MKSSFNLHIPRHNLEQLSMHDLDVVMSAVAGARDAMMGVKNQPRCQGGALSELEEMLDGFNELVDMIAGVAERAKPQGSREATIRAYLIIHHETTYVDNFADVLASAQLFQDGIKALKATEGRVA